MSNAYWQQCLNLVDSLPTPALPNSLPNRIDPFVASPTVLAAGISLFHSHCAQSSLPGKHKDDPLSLHLSVVTDLGNMIDIPKATTQRLSASPVPIVAAPASNGDGDSPPQSEAQTAQVSDRDIFNNLPLLTDCSLFCSGLDTHILPSGPADQPYTATGAKLVVGAAVKQSLRTIFLLADRSVQRANMALSPVLHGIFDLSKLPGLSTVFPVSHAYQKLLVLLTNKTFRDKVAIKQNLALIGSSPLNNVADLSCFTQEITDAHILESILARFPPFDPPKQVVHQALLNVQRGSALHKLPHHVRAAIDPALQEFLDEFDADNYVDLSSIMVRLAPLFPPKASSPDQPEQLDAMLARASSVSRASCASLASGSNTVVQPNLSESALMARPDTGRDSRSDSRQRQAPSTDRRVPDRREPDRRQDRPSVPQDRPSSAGPPRPRDDSQPSSASLKSLQDRIGDLQRDLAYMVRAAKTADKGRPQPRQQRHETHIAVELPSSYSDDDNVQAMGAIHIDPDSWSTPATFPREDVDYWQSTAGCSAEAAAVDRVAAADCLDSQGDERCRTGTALPHRG